MGSGVKVTSIQPGLSITGLFESVNVEKPDFLCLLLAGDVATAFGIGNTDEEVCSLTEFFASLVRF